MRLHRIKREGVVVCNGYAVPNPKINVEVINDFPKPKLRPHYFKQVRPIPPTQFYFRSEN